MDETFHLGNMLCWLDHLLSAISGHLYFYLLVNR
jgi:hypothetical protein